MQVFEDLLQDMLLRTFGTLGVFMIPFAVRCSPWLRVEQTGLGILL
jgi:hypothetical protein